MALRIGYIFEKLLLLMVCAQVSWFEGFLRSFMTFIYFRFAGLTFRLVLLDYYVFGILDICPMIRCLTILQC